MDDLTNLVVRSRAGDLDAYGRLVERTQRMAQAVAFDVLRDASLAEDAAQEAYIRAFRHLGDIQDPAAFPGWLRRIVVTVALNARRARRHTWLCLDDAAIRHRRHPQDRVRARRVDSGNSHGDVEDMECTESLATWRAAFSGDS